MTKHFSDDFDYGPTVSSVYSIADLYAAQSYLQAKLSHPMARMLSDEEFQDKYKELDIITTELRKRVALMIKDYETP